MDDNTRHHAPPAGGDARFSRLGVNSDAAEATVVRNEFGEWLQNHFLLDDQRLSDVLLAVYEALANAAEYAYLDAPQPGTVDFSASHWADSDTLDVTVADRGTWHAPEVPASRFRGRGIPLMRALADSASIDASCHGTEVTLAWSQIQKRCH